MLDQIGTGINDLLNSVEDYELNEAFAKLMQYTLETTENLNLTQAQKRALREYVFNSKDPLVLRWHEIELLKGKKVER